MSWPTQQLGDLMMDGCLPYGIVQPGMHVDGGIPIVRVKDVRSGEVSAVDPLCVAPSVSARHARTILRGGEVLLTIVGSVGECAVVPAQLEGWNVARAIAVLRPLGVSSKWLQLALQSAPVREFMFSRLNTTVQATLNLADLRLLPIPVPPKVVMSRIEELMRALDEKISVNALAMAAADSLLRGRYELIRRRVPDVIRLAEIVEEARIPCDPAGLEASTPYVGLEHMPRRQLWLSTWGAPDDLVSSKKRFECGDLLFGRLRPYFHKVSIAPLAGVCSTEVIVLRAREPHLRGLAALAASSDAVVGAAVAASEGTRMPRVNWSDLGNVFVPWPSSADAMELNEEFQTLERYVGSLVAQSRVLGELRETLLGPVMSGRLKIKDAERVVEEVV